jgi:acetamidase/formamidase
MGYDTESHPKTVTITDGFIHWSDKLQIPAKPMIGTLGTSALDGRPNSYGGYYGGNMDVQEVSAGTTVYLPVLYPGALLNVGDVHAIQGDGEICCAGGIECRARVTLRTSLVQRTFRQQCVTAEDSAYLMTIACLETTDESFQMACGELVRFVCSRYAISPEECYMLASQVMQARCTQYVNPTRSYVCKMPKAVLDAGFARR